MRSCPNTRGFLTPVIRERKNILQTAAIYDERKDYLTVKKEQESIVKKESNDNKKIEKKVGNRNKIVIFES